MTTKQQTNTDVMTKELQRVQRELAIEERTGVKRSIPWISINLATGKITAPPKAKRVVK